MSNQRPRLSANVEKLRQAFDDSFALPARLPDMELEQFLAIRVADQPLALRVGDLTRLEARRELVSLPVGNLDLLGIAGIQGRLVPVFSLASLLGFKRDHADWRWIAVYGLPDPLGLAFGSLDAFFSVPKTNVFELGREQTVRGHARHAVCFKGDVRNIIQLDSIQAALRNTASACRGPVKE